MTTHPTYTQGTIVDSGRAVYHMFDSKYPYATVIDGTDTMTYQLLTDLRPVLIEGQTYLVTHPTTGDRYEATYGGIHHKVDNRGRRTPQATLDLPDDTLYLDLDEIPDWSPRLI